MATTSTSGSDKNPNNFVSSTYHRAVCLQDWWLIRTEEDINGRRRLGVEGLTLRDKQQAVRVFSSAPIMKRHDIFTLETVDGITVLIKGCINKSRSLENGFPSEVCSHFLLGFPYYWGTYADQCDRKESTTTDLSRSMPTFDEGLDGQAVIKTLDNLISTPGVSGDSKLRKSIDTDVLEQCRGYNLETHKLQIFAEPLSVGPLSTNKEAKKISNEQENLNKDGNSDPESVGPEITCFQEKSRIGIIAIPNIQLRAEVVCPSGIEPLTTQETSICNDVTASGMHISPSKRSTRNCLIDTPRNYNCEALEDHLVPTISYEGTAFSAMTKGVSAENSRVGITKSSNSVEKSRNEQDTVKAICRLKDKSTHFCLLKPQEYEADMVSPVGITVGAGAISSLSDETFQAAENCSLSATGELHKTLLKFGKHENSIVKDEIFLKEPLCLTSKKDVISKDFSIPVGSDVNGASLTEVYKVVLDDTKTLSRLELSNSSMKPKRKSERSKYSTSCTYGTKNDFIGHVSSSIYPDMRNIPHSEVNMAGSMKRFKSSSTVKLTNLHSISMSQDYKAVKGTLAKEKLGQVLSVAFEGTLKYTDGNVGKSVPHVGSPKISERGENRNWDTMTGPTVKLKMGSNGISLLQVGTDTLNSTPVNNVPSNGNWFKNLEVSEKNSSPAVGSESNEPISTYEVLNKLNREHLMKFDVSETTPRTIKRYSSKKTVKPSEATRSSGRLKNLRDRCKDQTQR